MATKHLYARFKINYSYCHLAFLPEEVYSILIMY